MTVEKSITVSRLLEFYGRLLSPAQKEATELYYNEDYSLSEISDLLGISRAGVRDRIVKSEKILFSTEEKLGLLAKFARTTAALEDIIAALNKQNDPSLLPVIKQAEKLLSEE